MSDPNFHYVKTTAASRKAAQRVRYIHRFEGTPRFAMPRVPGKVYTIGATRAKVHVWIAKQAKKRARRLAKVAA